MNANNPILGAAYSPEVMNVINEAFDKAWAEIGGRYNDAAAIEQARTRLAQAIMEVSSGSASDPDQLKTAALCAMAAP
jgi:hypothetical protein